MLQTHGSHGKVVTLLPSMVRARPSVLPEDGERGTVLLFTGVRQERLACDAAGADLTAADQDRLEEIARS